MCIARRALVGALVAFFLLAGSAAILAQEPLPTPPESQGGYYCPTFDNRPLTALSVDISPKDAEGQIVAEANLPANCMPAPAAEPTPLFLDYGPGCCDWNCRDLLQFARFCHPKLLFEDPLLERYGVDYFCPSCHAVREFTCDLVLLPARLLVYKRQPCVKTPTPHCFSNCGVCGF